MHKNIKNIVSVIPLLLFFGLTACATVTTLKSDTNSHEIHGIDCSGLAVSMSTCYKKAEELCPVGYQIIANDAPSGYENLPWFSAVKLSDAIAQSIPGVKKGITIKCK